MNKGTISKFLERNFLHFNALRLIEAAKAYEQHIASGGKMMLALAGAMSTAEIGISLAEMIREGKVQSISCTGANLEEDVFNLVAHDHYKRIPNYQNLSPQDELDLLHHGFNRVTDTCIPEVEAMSKIERTIFRRWKQAQERGERYFPHEFFYQLLLSGELEESYQVDPSNSWLLAAAKQNIPIVVPGWEDSTLGNAFAAHCLTDQLLPSTVKSGIEYMMSLADWYVANCHGRGVGLLQVGGGIAGDFPICVVPMLVQDMKRSDVPLWSYFCQISNSTTSYGSYSGASPNEKISWGKLAPSTPRFIIESDATIVAPLIFAWILNQ